MYRYPTAFVPFYFVSDIHPKQSHIDGSWSNGWAVLLFYLANQHVDIELPGQLYNSAKLSSSASPILKALTTSLPFTFSSLNLARQSHPLPFTCCLAPELLPG